MNPGAGSGVGGGVAAAEPVGGGDGEVGGGEAAGGFVDCARLGTALKSKTPRKNAATAPALSLTKPS